MRIRFPGDGLRASGVRSQAEPYAPGWLEEVHWDFATLSEIRWPTFDPIRADPRYPRLLDRYGVPR